MSELETLAERLGRELLNRGEWLATAESCTGGLASSQLTAHAGASAAVLGGVVAYTNTVKIRELGVPAEKIDKYSAVSTHVAKAMAEGIRTKFGSDWGIATTGYAGPSGGDELNLVKPGRNYGWPLVSEGDHYDGRPIPRHATRPDLAAPAIAWNPVIAPGDFIFYRGGAFPTWQGQAIIAAMKPAGLVRVSIDGEVAREGARYRLDHRIRAIAEREDGSIWLLEDGQEGGAGRLLRMSPQPKG